MSHASGMRTVTGDYKFDYESTANKPKMFTKIDVDGTPVAASEEFDSFSLVAGNNIKLDVNNKQVKVSMQLQEDELVQQVKSGVLQSVLSDGTKILYGVKQTDDVNKVLQFIAKNQQPVGALRSSARTDLGDKWLLCDGSTFAKSQYPELAKMYPSWFASDVPFTTCEEDSPYYSSSNTQGDICEKMVNGYYIIGRSSSFYYSTSPEGPWTQVSTLGEYWHIDTFGYDNGLYYYGCRDAGETDDIYFATSTDIGSGWTRTRVQTYDTVDIFGTGYLDPYWVYTTSVNNFYYGTSIGTSMTRPSNNGGMAWGLMDQTLVSFFVAGGYIICSTVLEDFSTDTQRNPIAYYTQDPTQPFSSVSDTLIVGYTSNGYFVEYLKITDELVANQAKYDIYLSKTPGSKDILLFKDAKFPGYEKSLKSTVVYIEPLHQYWVKNDGMLYVLTEQGWESGHAIKYLVGNTESGFITKLNQKVEYINNFEDRRTLPTYLLDQGCTYIKGKL